MPEPSLSDQSRTRRALYIRSFIFGTEDSLVSTVGLLAGVAVAGVTREDIIVAGVVLIFVEALSMAVGSFLSEDAAEEYVRQGDAPVASSVRAGSIMFISYFAFGFIPLAPYLIWPVAQAFWLSIGASLAALWLLGFVSGRKFRVNQWRSALKMLILGGAAIGIGVIVGQLLNNS